ncbi:hypothetical protein [Arthrobacter koreensis]|uniref:hypothetical protein n=1 Tax=Arthrobacter koreensis TaxID=199136 RepID=UPI00380840DF
MNNVRQADLLAKKKTPEERASQLTGIHKAYTSMMVLQCLQPLGQGVSAKNVLNTIGMASAMWMLSPNFRQQVGDFGGQMKDAVTAKIAERRENSLDKTAGKVDKKGAKRAAKGKPLSARWQSRLERVERAQRGGRDPFTAQSAGMTEVALAENAYAAMRVDGADVEGIRDAYTTLREDLYAKAREDGVEPEDIARASRVVIGIRLDDEPDLASVFTELSHGQFAKSDPREVRLGGSGETAHVWTGEFESRLGQPVETGSFELRGPLDAAQHRKAIADTMTTDMISLIRENGVEGLNLGVTGYAAAWALKDHPGHSEMLTMDNPLGERLRASRLMRGTMDQDGIPAEEQRHIYSNAYVDALGHISALHPEAEQAWAETYGSNWREDMRDFARDPHTWMNSNEAWAGTENAWAAGPAPTRNPDASGQAARRYRSARINQNYIETAKTGITGFGSDASDFRDPDFDMGG